ncbi:MAG: hypothetical protein ACREUF_07675 [Solimonas sp.]
MTVRHYHSTDAGAPILTGQAGSLISLLDAILVNGYDSKPGLGWTIAYSSGDKRAYRLNSATQSGRYLRVDDSNAQYAIVNAYNAMTDVDTGTGGFPSTATARYWRKSASSDAVARAWDAYGDEAFLYLFVKWSTTAVYLHAVYTFGDLVPLADNPGVVSVMTGYQANNSTFPYQSSGDFLNPNMTNAGTNIHAIPAYDGTLTEQNGRGVGHYMIGGQIGDGWLPLTNGEPNGVGLRASPCLLSRLGGNQVGTNPPNWMVGEFPGLLCPWHRPNGSTLHGTVYNDLIDGGGRSYMLQGIDVGNVAGGVLMDITGPWR